VGCNHGISIHVDEASCAALSGEIYCVGGYTGPTISSDVYQAALSSSGVGQWVAATNYPSGVWAESCVASNGIYCVGGASNGSAVLNGVYYMGGQTAASSSTTGTTSQSVSSGASSSLPLEAIAVVDGIIILMVAAVGTLYRFRVRGKGSVGTGP
jgi:hypothetical protein